MEDSRTVQGLRPDFPWRVCFAEIRFIELRFWPTTLSYISSRNLTRLSPNVKGFHSAPLAQRESEAARNTVRQTWPPPSLSQCKSLRSRSLRWESRKLKGEIRWENMRNPWKICGFESILILKVSDFLLPALPIWDVCLEPMNSKIASWF